MIAGRVLNVMRAVAALSAAVLLAGPASAQGFGTPKSPVFGEVDTGHLLTELIPGKASIAPGETIHVGLRQRIDKGWHTYWRNPGDSGEATQIKWTLPAGWSAGEIVWPTPDRQPTGPLMNYGYAGEVLLPVALTAPASVAPGQTIELTAAVAFLVCEEICVPEDAVLGLRLPVVAVPAGPHPQYGPVVAAALQAAPKAGPLSAAFSRQGEALKLAVSGPPLAGTDAAEAYFFPFDGTAIDHAKPQAIERGPQGLTLTLTPGYGFQSPTPPAELAGVLSLADGRAFEVTAQAGPLPAAASGLGPPPARAPPGGGGDLGLIAAIGFALIGGLILNLMPCVFPILAMKAAGLARHAHERREAQRQGLAFLAGVLATFLALAGLLIALKAAGAVAGWGFQLQSPPVVAALALLMLAVALNLSGVFEVGTSLQGAGTGLASRKGLAGAFFTGALAVIVAAPCTAPFMAPALGWALTQSAASALLVFLALGLGFALPFVLVAFVPGLLSRLPRPGPWMVGFRKLLAFPMYGAAAWLAWVLTVQAGDMALARLFAAGVALALAAWLGGVAQRRQALGGRPLLASSGAGVLAAAALAAAVWPGYRPATAVAGEAVADIPYEAYSPERLAAARAEGRPVFVNFTAAWCITCKVNERTALTRADVADAFRRTGTVYLKADWTLKDELIAAELARHGRAGVPLYLVYGKSSADGVILPQILTGRTVVQALETAAAG
jgi:thiol:disulfide interchange protein DsbD